MMCATRQVGTDPDETRNVLTCQDVGNGEDEDGLKIVIMIAMIKKESGEGTFILDGMEECHILAGKIWSEKEKENSAGKYLIKE